MQEEVFVAYSVISGFYLVIAVGEWLNTQAYVKKQALEKIAALEGGQIKDALDASLTVVTWPQYLDLIGGSQIQEMRGLLQIQKTVARKGGMSSIEDRANSLRMLQPLLPETISRFLESFEEKED